MTRTVFEVQAVFPCAEAREDAKAELMACGYDKASFGLGWPGPEVPAPPRHEDGGTALREAFLLTVRARDDVEQTQLLSKIRAAGALRALAVMRLE